MTTPATILATRDPDPAELAKFMAIIRQHENGGSYEWREDFKSSGHFGAYQIGRTEWAAWSAAAGVNPADHSPAAQDKVAALQFTNYYRTYGSWELVGVAWFGGPGMAAAEKVAPGSQRHKGDGGSTVGDYMDYITRGMAGAAPAGTTPAPTTGAAQGAAGIGIPGAGTLSNLADFVGLLLDGHTWVRIGLVVGGAALVAGGMAIMGVDLGGVSDKLTAVTNLVNPTEGSTDE